MFCVLGVLCVERQTTKRFKEDAVFRRPEHSMPTVAPRWDALSCDEAATANLAAALDVAPMVARLLCQRGFSDPEQASRFLKPSLDHLHDPMALADMAKAVDRVLGALAR